MTDHLSSSDENDDEVDGNVIFGDVSHDTLRITHTILDDLFTGKFNFFSF